jgi:hypothetical protein
MTYAKPAPITTPTERMGSIGKASLRGIASAIQRYGLAVLSVALALLPALLLEHYRFHSVELPLLLFGSSQSRNGGLIARRVTRSKPMAVGYSLTRVGKDDHHSTQRHVRWTQRHRRNVSAEGTFLRTAKCSKRQISQLVSCGFEHERQPDKRRTL